MEKIIVNSTKTQDVIREICTNLNGSLTEKWGEQIVSFNNFKGCGTVKCKTFGSGVSIMEFYVNFKATTRITFNNTDPGLLEYIYISDGQLEYEDNNEQLCFDRYQNIIVYNPVGSEKSFVFPKLLDVKVNIIHVDTKAVLEEQRDNYCYLEEFLASIGIDKSSERWYHLGNYNLKIADQIKELTAYYDSPIVNSLTTEGYVNIVMGMQIHEYQKYINGQTLPDSITAENIENIQQLTKYIEDNIAEPLSIATLTKKVGIGPKKLQLGFQVLYSKSVNEYVRDLKLDIARDKLKNSDLSISEVVYSIGLKSRSYFSKTFYDRFGILPKNYRSHVKKNNLL